VKKKRTKAVRKPRALVFGQWLTLEPDYDGEFYLNAPQGIGIGFDTRDARKIAAWLTRFADWSDSRRGK
jgi:hypothetical protein